MRWFRKRPEVVPVAVTVRAETIAEIILELSAREADDALDAFCREVWERYPKLVPTVFYLWWLVGLDKVGTGGLEKLVSLVSSNIASAPFEQASSRSIVCDMLYGMQDDNAARAIAAWDRVVVPDGWPVAQEVMSMMTAIFHKLLLPASTE
jgi:hypothetical protein